VVLIGSLDNVPSASLNNHAIARHGTDAITGYAEYESGNCTMIYRSPNKNRVIRVVGSGVIRTGIVTTCSGKAITCYMAPAIYWTAKTVGYEYLGSEGICP